MNRLGIDSQTVFGMPPADHIDLAARLGCGHISIGLGPVPWQLAQFAPWSLREARSVRLEVVQRAADNGISLSLGEGFAIRPGSSVAGLDKDLDHMTELGVVAVGTVAIETDRSRAMDELAMFASMTHERGLDLYLEFAPPHAFPNLHHALLALRVLGSPHAKLIIDAMHLFRCGNSVEQVAQLAPSLIGRVQMSDAAMVGSGKPYMEEACFERSLPGEGELPLQALAAVLPPRVPVCLEVPNRGRAADIATLEEYAGQAMQRVRALF
ncbi:MULTISPECIES: sugar phosphate isomerase/epimerase [unclassified Novosphingobium]|uniref:sugar phosphate isomerase/epimerase family protein n=1 Tax=unclassified Novosphingobium TaxID=2644732 RepID=UPI001356E9F7|nr:MULTISPECIES: TIM barrel protein [unclassified Novosphingobium]